MHIVAPISNHRLARRFRWAELWLGWVGSVVAFLRAHALFSKPAQRVVERWLDQTAKLIACYLYLAADRRTPPPRLRRNAGGPPRQRRGFSLRAHLGSRLRRALRHRDIDRRIALLRAAIANPEPAIRALMRRICKGLTRRAAPLWTAGVSAGKTSAVAPSAAGETPAVLTPPPDSS